MKFVRFFLWILSLIVAAFLATGLLFKETKYTIKTATIQPLEKVFNAFTNQDSLKIWMPELISTQPLAVNEEYVGSTFAIELQDNLDTIKMHQQIMAFVPNRKLTLRFDSEDIIKIDDYDFENVGDSTVITKKVINRSRSYLLQCLLPYLKTSFIEADQKYLDNFKDYINSNK